MRRHLSSLLFSAQSQKSPRRVRRVALVGALAAGLLAPAVSMTSAVSAAATGPTNRYMSYGFTNKITGVTVSGYDGKNVLASISTNQGTLELTKTSGLTLAYGYTSYKGTALNFTGTQAAVNAALATLTLTLPSTARGGVNFRTMFTEARTDLAFYPQNQHFYKFVPYGVGFTGAKDRFTASDLALASTEFGLKGYLATITDAAENEFVSNKIQGAQNVWIGGTDGATEGEWTFEDIYGVWPNPDKGSVFWRGCSPTHPTFPGTALGYQSWYSAGGEPNNYHSGSGKCQNGTTVDIADQGEDCMVTNWDDSIKADNPRVSTSAYGVGYWNDVPCYVTTNPSTLYTYERLQGYVIEYGDQVRSSSYPTGVDLKTTQFLVMPAPKIPTFKDKVAAFTSKLKKALEPPKKKKVNNVECPNIGSLRKVSGTLTLKEPGTYTLNFHYGYAGGSLPRSFECGSKFGDKVMKSAQDRHVITTSKPNQALKFSFYVATDKRGGGKDEVLVFFRSPDTNGSTGRSRLINIQTLRG